MLTVAEQLMHTTIRIESMLKNGIKSTGTGFVFAFRTDATSRIPLIITNKHVIKDSKTSSFVITKAKADGSPDFGNNQVIQLDDSESLWTFHPDDNVDLAAFPIARIMSESEKIGIKLFIKYLNESHIPTATQINELGGMEEITMIGYPNGLWDYVNNMPIARKGIAATNPKFNWNGDPVFLIDCACFPGSSGSPVLIFNQGSYTDARGNLVAGGDRVFLMGVLFAGPQHIAEGEIKIINVPMTNVPISLSKIPNNLGFVIKAEKIKDFLPFFTKTPLT